MGACVGLSFGVLGKWSVFNMLVDNTGLKNPSHGLKDLVVETLKSVCEDLNAPAAARAQAARTLAEVSGLLGKYQAPPTDEETHSELLTESELDASIAALQKRLKA